jgi:hypothetical protein
MSVRSFREVFMVGGVAAAALGCYLVSLRVASERAALENVETEIVLAERDIRLLQTEIGTRGRLAQLERWNARVLLLSAPTADQFVADSFHLARLVTPEKKPTLEAPVVYASAPAAREPGPLPEGKAQPSASTPLMHEAGLKVPATGDKPRRPEATTIQAKPAEAAGKKAAPTKMAKADPLAPLASPKKKPPTKAKPATTSTAKDDGKSR